MKTFSFFALSIIALSNLYAQSTTNGTSTSLPEIVVNANRYKEVQTDLWKTPGGVSLVTSPQIEQTRATNLKDVFELTPGVYSQPRQGAADENTLSIRGSGIRNAFHLRGVRLYLDGMLLSNADGFSDFDAVELLALDHIEVFKGANGLALGSSALGGGINFVSKTGYNSELAKVRTEVGSFGFVRGQVSTGQKFSNGLDYYASGTALREDGYRRHQDLERERFYGNLGWRVYEDTIVRFYMMYMNARDELAGDLTKTQLQLAPQSAASANLALNQRRDSEALRPAVAVTHMIDPDQRLEANLYWQWRDLDHPLAFAFIDNEFNDAGTEIRYINTAEIADKDNEFVFGLSPQYGRILDANYVNNQGNRGALTKLQVDETWNVGTWFQDTYSFADDWKVVGGTRFDWSSRSLTDRFLSNGDQSGELNYTGFGPKLGLIYNITSDIETFGNLSMAVEPPTFSEQALSGTSGLVNIEAQESYQMEVGARGKWDRMNWDLAVYEAEIEDELFQNTLPGGQSLLSNIPRSRHTGIELGYGVKLWGGLLECDKKKGKQDYIKLSTSYTWSDFRILSDGSFTGKRLPGMPEHYWVTELSYNHPCGFYYAFVVETVPQGYFVDKANNLQNDGYTTFGMKSGMQFNDHWKIFTEIRNLTDVAYASAVSTSEIANPNTAAFKPADGFAMYGGFEWTY